MVCLPKFIVTYLICILTLSFFLVCFCLWRLNLLWYRSGTENNNSIADSEDYRHFRSNVALKRVVLDDDSIKVQCWLKFYFSNLTWLMNSTVFDLCIVMKSYLAFNGILKRKASKTRNYREMNQSWWLQITDLNSISSIEKKHLISIKFNNY